MEDAMNVNQASVSKGKTHAMELLIESFGKTPACPVEATIFGASSENPT
jgi:hypothetical protein